MADPRNPSNQQYPQQPQIPGQMPYPPAPPSGQAFAVPGQPQYPPGQGYAYPNPTSGQPYYPQTNQPLAQMSPMPPYTQGYGYGSTPANYGGAFNQYDDLQDDRGIKYMDTYMLFSDQSIRRAFIRKVYTTLTIQLLLSSVIICVFTFVQPVKVWVQQNRLTYWLAFGIFFAVFIIIVCCERIGRKFPINYLLLIALTLSLSYMAGTIASFHDSLSVFIAFTLTAILTLCLTMVALFTKMDFTKCYAFLIFISIALFLIFIACIIVGYVIGPSKVLLAVYAGVGVLAFSMFLCFDTQMTVGGRTHQYSEEDYIFATTQLYVDVIQLFLFILTLVGLARQ